MIQVSVVNIDFEVGTVGCKRDRLAWTGHLWQMRVDLSCDFFLHLLNLTIRLGLIDETKEADLNRIQIQILDFKWLDTETFAQVSSFVNSAQCNCFVGVKEASQLTTKHL